MGDEADSLDDQGAAEEVLKYDPLPGHSRRPNVTLAPWEWQHVCDLAYMVKNSKQNVGNDMREKAESVWNIMQKKVTK